MPSYMYTNQDMRTTPEWQWHLPTQGRLEWRKIDPDGTMWVTDSKGRWARVGQGYYPYPGYVFVTSSYVGLLEPVIPALFPTYNPPRKFEVITQSVSISQIPGLPLGFYSAGALALQIEVDLPVFGLTAMFFYAFSSAKALEKDEGWLAWAREYSAGAISPADPMRGEMRLIGLAGGNVLHPSRLLTRVCVLYQSRPETPGLVQMLARVILMYREYSGHFARLRDYYD